MKKLVAMVVSTLIIATPLAPPAKADGEECARRGVESAIAPKLLPAPSGAPYENNSTDTVEPLDAVNVNALGLSTPGVLKVVTQDDGAPNICMDSHEQLTGFDNDLLRAVAARLGLVVEFHAAKLDDIVASVKSGEFDLGSASLTSTDVRRASVDFTNGYDFGYNTVVVFKNSTITGFNDLTGKRVGVQQSSAQAEYVIGTLKLQPVLFPDFSAAFAGVTTQQIDAWVGPEGQARRAVQSDDSAVIVGSIPLNRFIAWPVSRKRKPLTDALNSALDAVIADGTWATLFQAWVPRPLPGDWKPGSKSAPRPQLEDLAAFAARNAPKTAPPKAASHPFLGRFGDLLKAGLPNTVVLSVGAAPIALLVGLGLALMTNSRFRWLRWPSRMYTGFIEGLPDLLVVLLVGLGMRWVLGAQTGYAPCLCAIVALGVMAAAYVGEILTPQMREVQGSQTGSQMTAIRHAIRHDLKPLLERFIWLLRASALVYFLGLVDGQRDLFGVALGLTGTVDGVIPLLAAAFCYLVMTIPLAHLVNHLPSARKDSSTVQR